MDALALVIVIPVIIGALCAAAGTVVPRWLLDALATLTALGVTAVGVVLLRQPAGISVSWQGHWAPTNHLTLGIALVADPMSAGLVALSGVLATAAFVFSWHYFDDADGVFHGLVLGFVAGLVGFALAGDLFTMFVFFELMGVAAFALTGHRSEEPGSLQGAINFGLLNSLGAYLGLLGVGLFFARTQALNLAQVGDQLNGKTPDALVIVAAGLVSVGWLVKGAFALFHFWLADAHAVAPSPVCVLFSGVMVEIGLYGVFRLQTVVFSGTLGPHPMHVLLLYGGALTAVVGTIGCFAQQHLKRMLALSTIAHAGLFAIGLSTLDEHGVGGSVVYVAAHAGAKGALFLSAGILLSRYGALSERELHGKARELRAVAVIWFLGALALSGLPPFGTWLGKSAVEEASWTAGARWATPLAVLVGAITAAAILRAGSRVFLGRGIPAKSEDDSSEEEGRDEDVESDEPSGPVPLSQVLPAALLLAGSLALGVIPRFAHGAAVAAAVGLDGTGYRAAVLDGATVPRPEPSHVPEFTPAGIAWGLTGTVLAVLVALAALGILRVRAPRWLTAGGHAGLKGLRTLHSGDVGDYTAWLVVGAAAVIVTLGATTALTQ